MPRIRLNAEIELAANEGSIPVSNSAGELEFLGIGTNTQVLTSDGTTASWQTPSAGGGTTETASNGLNKVVDDIRLGGALIADTTVSGGSTSVSTGSELTLDTLKKFTANFENIAFNLDTSRFLHTTSTPHANNANITYGNQFVGYKAGQAFGASSIGYANTVFGRQAALILDGDNTNASSNAIFGYGALESTQYAQRNTVLGVAAMGSASAGTSGTPLTGNVAIGHHAYRQGSSSYNIAIGASALENQTTVLTDIIGIGQNALKVNAGSYNIGIGYQAGAATTTGGKNVYLGWGAGQLNTTPTENTHVGYNAGGAGIQTSGYNTLIGSTAGQVLTSGNSNTALGRASGKLLTTGSNNTFLGHNTGSNGTLDITTGSANIFIGYNAGGSAVSASNELNIGNCIFGQNLSTSGTVFTLPRLTLGKRSTTANSTLDMGACALPIILPKSASTPTIGLESAMTYYNTNTDGVDLYSGTSGFVPIVKIQPVTTTTSISGQSLNANIYKVILDASVNAVTQTIGSASATNKNNEFIFKIINSTTNLVTFNVPAGTYVNGVIRTTFTVNNGGLVRASSDGTTWYISLIHPCNTQTTVSYNGLNPTLGHESIAYFNAAATGTITLPTAANGRTITLVNDGALALTIGSTVKTGNATTTTTLALDQRMTISYDSATSQWRKIN